MLLNLIGVHMEVQKKDVFGRFSLSSVPRAVEDVIARSYKSGIMMDNGLALNETAADIYRRCDGKTTIGDLIKTYGITYAIDHETATGDVQSVLSHLVDHQAIII